MIKVVLGEVDMRQYRWHFDRMIALLVATINVIFTIVIVGRFAMDRHFLFMQMGLKGMSNIFVYIACIIAVIVAIYLNYLFLKKNHMARLVLAFFETLVLAACIRNLFMGQLFFGFSMSSVVSNVIVFLLYATLVYHTLFSNMIKKYFYLQ